MKFTFHISILYGIKNLELEIKFKNKGFLK